MEIKIRPYKQTDKKALSSLIDDFKDFIVSIDPHNIDQRKSGYGKRNLVAILKRVSKEHGIIYVAETKGKKIIGYTVSLVLPKESLGIEGTRKGVKIGEVFDLYVDTYYRDKKIGTKLMSEAELYLKKKGCTHINIGVFWPNEKARKFYEKLGYVFYNVTYIRKIK